MHRINFWNGNKTSARKSYETTLLSACLEVTTEQYGPVHIEVDDTDYPVAKDEGMVLEAKADILVTVAGNAKFSGKDKIVIQQPLAKGMLGYRLLIAPQNMLKKLAEVKHLEQLKSLLIGIPDTWADASLFRHNGCRVVEQGRLDDLFIRLKKGDFDYVALGVNEIDQVLHQYAAGIEGLAIESNLMLFYPFPLVFYVSAKQPLLAQRVEHGLRRLLSTGEHEKIFQQHYGYLVHQFNLQSRSALTLTNPMLPQSMRDFSQTFLGCDTA